MIEMCPWLGRSRRSYQTDLLLSQVPHRAPSQTTSCCRKNCFISYSMLHLHFPLYYLTNKLHMLAQEENRPCEQQCLRPPKKILVDIIISMFNISRKLSFSLTLGLTRGRILSIIFFSGDQFGWHRPSSMSLLH